VKHLHLSSFAFLFGLGLVVAACATATDDTAVTELDSGSKADVKLDAKLGPDGKPINPDGGGQCPSQCTSDQDCIDGCPNPQSGTNCCDTQTGICYVEPSQTCPSPPDSSVGGG
jgi:hypothetical protein